MTVDILAQVNRYRFLMLLAALAAFVLAYYCRADLFLSLGLLDDSLTSDNPLTRHTTVIEIMVARGALALLAAGFLMAGLWGERIGRTAPVQALRRLPDRLSAAGEAGLGTVWNLPLMVLVPVAILLIVYAATGERVFTLQQMERINLEDGVIEDGQFVFLLLASVTGFAWFVRGRANGARRFMWLGLGLLFFAMAGEEISWGQRILGFGTPKAIEAINVQHEFNLHNMLGYLFDHLFILGFFCWGVILPILYRTLADVRRVVVATGLPVPSAGLAVGMFLASLMQEPVVQAFMTPAGGLRVAEMRELMSALSFFLLMLETRRTHGVGQGRPAQAAKGRPARA
jgi:hypothetical protein